MKAKMEMTFDIDLPQYPGDGANELEVLAWNQAAWAKFKELAKVYDCTCVILDENNDVIWEA